jgi:hypothetical protein
MSTTDCISLAHIVPYSTNLNGPIRDIDFVSFFGGVIDDIVRRDGSILYGSVNRQLPPTQQKHVDQSTRSSLVARRSSLVQ